MKWTSRLGEDFGYFIVGSGMLRKANCQGLKVPQLNGWLEPCEVR